MRNTKTQIILDLETPWISMWTRKLPNANSQGLKEEEGRKTASSADSVDPWLLGPWSGPWQVTEKKV